MDKAVFERTAAFLVAAGVYFLAIGASRYVFVPLLILGLLCAARSLRMR